LKLWTTVQTACLESLDWRAAGTTNSNQTR